MATVMMIAYADPGTALNAINHSEAYRFVVKPWDNQELEDFAYSLTHKPARAAPGHERMIEVVMRNLLDNAWKYTLRHWKSDNPGIY